MLFQYKPAASDFYLQVHEEDYDSMKDSIELCYGSVYIEVNRNRGKYMGKEFLSDFRQGVKDGFPICLGYLSVSFAFGITVVTCGFSPWVAVLISMSNLTSAGQLAGVTVMAAGGSLIEMAMTQLVINIRYALMSFALSQKLSDKFTLADRFLASFVITDEIYAVAASSEKQVEKGYMLGLSIIPAAGWVLGTALGSLAGGILPAGVISALGIAIYGMFIAIIVPQALRFRPVLVVVLTAIMIRCLFSVIPGLSALSEGFKIIVSAVVSSFAGALLYPVQIGEVKG